MGFDVTTPEARAAMEKRMARFGGTNALQQREKRRQKFGDVETVELVANACASSPAFSANDGAGRGREAKNAAAVPAHEPSEEAVLRGDAIYVYGTDKWVPPVDGL